MSLRRDSWNDYGYVTLFHPTLHLDDGRKLELDTVKIVKRGQRSDVYHSPLRGEFSQLRDDYCSLGQSVAYYELLRAEGPGVYAPFLTGLRDIAYLPGVEREFREDAGVQTSLRRFATAANALREARSLFHGAPAEAEPGKLTFSHLLPGTLTATTFAFGELPDLPARAVAVVGHNGSGKTQLLAQLAVLASADARELQGEGFAERHGSFAAIPASIGAVVAVSYSAFDEFPIPGQGAGEEAALERTRLRAGEQPARPYNYMGLRQVDKGGELSHALKGTEELETEFAVARRLVSRRHREAIARNALSQIASEPSFETLAGLLEQWEAEPQWLQSFRAYGAGQRIVLSIIVGLCAHLDRRALVLIDEPELHLHPPLAGALLRAVATILDHHDAFAVIATHSPVVLQEIPGRNVKIVSRHGSHVSIGPPGIETYAENVGLLTQHVFNLDSSRTDYQARLARLARDHDLPWFEALFGGRMSSQARAIVMAMQRARRRAGAAGDHKSG